jgi:hypothetical protein
MRLNVFYTKKGFLVSTGSSLPNHVITTRLRKRIPTTLVPVTNGTTVQPARSFPGICPRRVNAMSALVGVSQDDRGDMAPCI